jgi:glycosyltransferase involved in cell wall biosynthesis
MAGAIHQLLSGFADGDAISHSALTLQEVFRRWGVASEIYVVDGHVAPAMQHRCKPLSAYRGDAADVAIHHYSIASPAVEVYVQTPAQRVMIYHNITPPDYFAGFDDRVALQLREALRQLPEVVARSHACWADSAFNAQDLTAAGCARARVFPLVFSSAPLDVPDDCRVMDKFKVKLTNLLYVGRIAPNKRVETLIEAFYWYHKNLNPFSRLILIGSDRSCSAYFDMLRMLVGDYDLANVCFEGFASPEGLPSYYRLADAFVSTSDHEGYCLPLLEAMHLGVPVVAHGIGGMPEAMNGAGVQYRGLKPVELSYLLHRVISEPGLRSDVLASQARRMEEVRKRDIEGELRVLLGELPGVRPA